MLYVWLVVYGAEVVKRGQRRLLISAEVAKRFSKIGAWITSFQKRLAIGAKAAGSGLGNSKNKDGTNNG
jgi:hypothetical protein